MLVDEASMLDLPLAAALLAALPRHRRPQLMLVGARNLKILPRNLCTKRAFILWVDA